MFISLWVLLTLSLGVATWVSKPQSSQRVYWSLFFYLSCSVFFLREFYWEPMKIEGRSMTPSLSNQEVVIVDKQAYGVNLGIYSTQNWKKYPSYYDIVAFNDVQDPDKTLLKRVYAKHGDTVTLSPKGWFVNNVFVSPLSPHSLNWLAHTGGQGVFSYWEQQERQARARHQWQSQHEASFSVPVGYVFVLGDNRNISRDSREFGLVPLSHVLGKVVLLPQWKNRFNFEGLSQ